MMSPRVVVFFDVNFEFSNKILKKCFGVLAGKSRRVCKKKKENIWKDKSFILCFVL